MRSLCNLVEVLSYNCPLKDRPPASSGAGAFCSVDSHRICLLAKHCRLGAAVAKPASTALGRANLDKDIALAGIYQII